MVPFYIAAPLTLSTPPKLTSELRWPATPNQDISSHPHFFVGLLADAWIVHTNLPQTCAAGGAYGNKLEAGLLLFIQQEPFSGEKNQTSFYYMAFIYVFMGKIIKLLPL